ncbi:hypothetical protein [Natronomonas sp. CBA1123]|nr:hypothetical protein [Natronomonas sp. CBA1123]
MTDSDAVEAFLEQADSTYEEYEQGYADADATLRRLKKHIEELRNATRE